MYINLTLLNQYLQQYKCPAQIYIDTDISDGDPVLKFLRGEDENGSRVEFLSYSQIDEILALNSVEEKMIAERDASDEEIMSRNRRDRDKDKNIQDVKYGLLAKYVIQLFAAGLGTIVYPELNVLPGHKESHFAGLYHDDNI